MKLTALGAYIFAGGFTIGVKKHFDVLAHFEDGPFGVATTQRNIYRNRRPLPVFSDPKSWPVTEYAGVDFLYANPPCAPWSNAGSKVGRIPWEKNPLTTCWRRTAELVWQLRPKVAAIESVRLLYTKGFSMIAEITREAWKNGYQVNYVFENAIDCNLPQCRPRFVLVLSRYAYQPSPTHGHDVTPREVLKHLAAEGQPVGNRRMASENLKLCIEYKALKVTPPGERLSKHFHIAMPNVKKNDKGIFKGKPSMLKYRIHPDEPSPTQTGSAILFHHKEDRYLTIGEAAALCGYPPKFEFMGSISSCYAQMGKAVLPPVGAHLAKDAARTIHAAEKLKSHDFQQARTVEVLREYVLQKARYL